MDPIKVDSGFSDDQDLSVQAKRGFGVPGIIRLHQDDETIAITLADVPALIEALRAAVNKATPPVSPAPREWWCVLGSASQKRIPYAWSTSRAGAENMLGASRCEIIHVREVLPEVEAIQAEAKESGNE